MAKPAHYQGAYHVDARRVRTKANANPNTRCWRCGRTKAEHQAAWHAGHIIDGLPGGPLAPECATCNLKAGAELGNQRRKEKRLNNTRRW